MMACKDLGGCGSQLNVLLMPVGCSECIRALLPFNRDAIVANQFLETELERLKAAVSMGYARGRLAEEAKTLPRDRKDWYD
jgi:hypothetical protein